MKRLLNQMSTTDGRFNAIAILTIIGLAMIPLFFNFPYRVNIFLSWEGAYRLYLGQMPFRDFGLPMGYGYWMIPALFFKLFGPFMSSLIKSQVFINMLSGLAFYSILGSFKVKPSIRALCVLIYCISYSFFNFWPWYNHSVIVYQFISFAFLLRGLFSAGRKQILYLVLAGLFAFLCFFTKQDGGGMGIMIITALLAVNFLYERKVAPVLYFYGSFALFACIFILPLLPHEFSYWFNYGQEPHNSRLALSDFVDVILGESMWLKFYIAFFVLILVSKLKEYKAFLQNKTEVLFYLFTIAILTEAAIFQVTSYTPPDNNIFFHSFAFVFLITQLPLGLNFSRPGIFVLGAAVIMLWWSGTYWKYIDRVLKRAIPGYAQTDPDKISVSTYMVSKNESNIGMDQWVFSDLRAFKGVYMPESTVKGIDRLLNMPVVKSNKALKVLNMTELTPLAHEMPYELETGLPLWYHLGVGIFDREVDLYCERINDGYYDIILFETIPYLNNFFPEKVRQAAMNNYEQADRFLAPRRPTDSHIEVYIKQEQP